jgi:hypothetical protein
LVIKSDKNNIREAYWGLWKNILGYDLKRIKKAEDIYLNPNERKTILNKLKHQNFYSTKVSIKKNRKSSIDLQVVFIKDNKNIDEHFVFILIDY